MDSEQARASVLARYGRLARAAADGAQVTDCCGDELLLGNLEDIPLPDGHVDVVVSNCVVNLSADKRRTLAEAFRVLRPGGRLGVSDVIASGGADQYRDQLLAAGFTGISITPAADAGGGLSSAIIQAVRPAGA